MSKTVNVGKLSEILEDKTSLLARIERMEADLSAVNRYKSQGPIGDSLTIGGPIGGCLTIEEPMGGFLTIDDWIGRIFIFD